MKSRSDPTMEEQLQPFVQAALSRKIEDPVVLDVRRLTSVADAFIICSGRSSRQVNSLGQHIVTRLKKQGIRPLHTEGLKEGQWVLIDYGHVVVHVFNQPVREFYDIEGLWADAPRMTLSGQRTGSEPEDE